MIPWRRNLYLLLFVQLMSTAGFSLVFPFLPLYVRELGIATRGSVEFWSGAVFSAQAFVMMLAAPVWGSLADRYGRKPMLVRATLGGAVLMILMGLAQSAEQLTVLRAIQGGVTGVISAATALAASTVPKEKSGSAMGLLQMGRWGGIALGPILGGIIGDAFGFRESFYITGTLLGAAGLAVLFWVREDFQPSPQIKRAGFFASYRALLVAPGMGGLYGLTFLRMLGRTVLTPIAPLFVVTLIGQERGAATITGLFIGSAALTSALSSVYLGRLGDRRGHGRVLVISAALAALFYLPQPFVQTAWQLIALQALTGAAIGGMLPTIAAMMNLWAPDGNQGATYGLETSVNAAARVIAPMLGAGAAWAFGLRGAFVAAALVYAVIALWAWRLARSPKARALRIHQLREQVKFRRTAASAD